MGKAVYFAEPAAAADISRGTGDEVVLSLSDNGLADAVDALEDRLDLVLASGARVLVLDMSAVETVSSTTVTVLLWAKRRCAARGLAVLLRQPSRRCVDTLRRIGLLGGLAVESSPLRAKQGAPSATAAN
jgi:anti-anti-sigma regulatory factor